MKTTAILNLKGGVAKTTTAANMGAVLTRDYGKRVLLVDADSQCNLSEFFGAVEDGQIGSLVDVLKLPFSANPEQLICTTGHKGLDILPGAKELMALDLSMLSGGKINYNAIKHFLARVADFYDYCFIDCPPAFNAAGAAALVAADDVLIPVKLDAFSLQGMGNLMEQIRNMQRINPALKVAGLLPTMYYPNEDAVKAREVLVNSDFRVFPSIRRSDKVDGMTYAQEPLCVYSPKSAAAVDYRRFVKAYVKEVN